MRIKRSDFTSKQTLLDMAPPDVSSIESLYSSVVQALTVGTAGIRAAISSVISAFLAGLDGGLVGSVLSWAIDKVISAYADLEAKALSIALRCEYLKRAGKVSVASARKAWNLTNKCSRCNCIGHNKQNHPSRIDPFLAENKLQEYVNDAEDLAGAAEEDGWWDWLAS